MRIQTLELPLRDVSLGSAIFASSPIVTFARATTRARQYRRIHKLRVRLAPVSSCYSLLSTWPEAEEQLLCVSSQVPALEREAMAATEVVPEWFEGQKSGLKSPSPVQHGNVFL